VDQSWVTTFHVKASGVRTLQEKRPRVVHVDSAGTVGSADLGCLWWCNIDGPIEEKNARAMVFLYCHLFCCNIKCQMWNLFFFWYSWKLRRPDFNSDSVWGVTVFDMMWQCFIWCDSVWHDVTFFDIWQCFWHETTVFDIMLVFDMIRQCLAWCGNIFYMM
jgi:hypothetical protein